MELSRWVGLAVAVAVLAAAGCGRKPHAARHDALAATPEPAPPTPDTTPIAALRTPAVLELLRADFARLPGLIEEAGVVAGPASTSTTEDAAAVDQLDLFG